MSPIKIKPKRKIKAKPKAISKAKSAAGSKSRKGPKKTITAYFDRTVPAKSSTKTSAPKSIFDRPPPTFSTGITISSSMFSGNRSGHSGPAL